MRRIDMVKNKTMYNIKHVKVLDNKRLKIVFGNGDYITILAQSEGFGGSTSMFIEVDNI